MDFCPAQTIRLLHQASRIASHHRSLQCRLSSTNQRRWQVTSTISRESEVNLEPLPNFSQGDTASTRLPRLPRALQTLHLKPLKREAEHGIPSCDLQLRSYSLQPLEFYTDFALRAAYYLGLPAYGPVPLPRIMERWTVPRDHFIFKKSQENFERITMRRLIQIKDGNLDVVQVWLAYLRKHQFWGVGMKANVWEFGELGVAKYMDPTTEELRRLEPIWTKLGQTRTIGTVEKAEELLSMRRSRSAAGIESNPETELSSNLPASGS